MVGMLGADVAQLRSLAQQFDRCADQLDSSRSSVSAAVASSPWRGADADRFRQSWTGQSIPRLSAAVVALRDAAVALRTNADQQESASATSANDAGGIELDGILGGASASLTVLDIANEFKRHFFGGRDLPRIFGPIGVALDVAEEFSRAQKGDVVGAGLTGGAAAADTAAALRFAGGRIALPLAVSEAFVNWTLPYNAESQADTYAEGVKQMFGRDVDPDALTLQQAQAMSQRYNGIWGVAAMISDTMEANADKYFPWNWGK